MKTRLWMLNYGYKVKVVNGTNKGKEGHIVVSFMYRGVGINTKEIPDKTYQIIEPSSRLEVLSTENPHNIQAPFPSELSDFDCAKRDILIRNPKMVLEHKEYFDEELINYAQGFVNKKN